MRYDEFVAAVRERGEYSDVVEAHTVTGVVLDALGRRLGPEARELAGQLPQEFHGELSGHASAESVTLEEFLQQVAKELSATPETARWDASAVLTTVTDAVPAGRLNRLLSRLEADYAELSGRPDLA